MASDGFAVELALIGILILLNGFFAGAEIAVISARKGRVQPLAEAGDRRAQALLRLKADPDRFLATVQIGITLVGGLASAVGGVAAVERLEPALASLPSPWLRSMAEPAAVGMVVFIIAYLSLVVGELIPKSLAVRHAETVSLLVARPIERLARVSRVAVAALTGSTRLALLLVGQGRVEPRKLAHTLDDVRAIVEEAQEQGILREQLASGALAFHDRAVREVMTPRPRIVAVRRTATRSEAWRLVAESRHTRYPVFEGAFDNVVGILYARDLLDEGAGPEESVASLVRPVTIVPDTMKATALLADIRRTRRQMAIVVDEHGSLVGIVTLEDLVEVIIGEIADEHEDVDVRVTVLGPDVLEVEGTLPVHELNEERGMELPESSQYVTIAGLVIDRLGAVPRGGEQVSIPPYRLSVRKMEGRRVARVRIERAPAV